MKRHASKRINLYISYKTNEVKIIARGNNQKLRWSDFIQVNENNRHKHDQRHFTAMVDLNYLKVRTSIIGIHCCIVGVICVFWLPNYCIVLIVIPLSKYKGKKDIKML